MGKGKTKISSLTLPNIIRCSAATKLSDHLLPRRLPRLAGIQLSATYLPVAKNITVGGDFYEVIKREDGKILMVIGDVAGHGLEAALVMSSVRKVLSCFGTLSNPDELIRQMNYWLCDNSERMVTIFCGLYDPASRVLTYASAGHPKPLLVTPAGPRFLENGNLPMGIFEEIDISTYTVFIPNDTLLVLYTDGLIEANRNIIEGLDKLTNEAQKIPSSVTNQAHYLVRKILSSSSFEDDVACITFHFDKPIKSRWLTSRWNGKINY